MEDEFLDTRFSVPPPAKTLCPDDQCLEFEDIEEDDDYEDESEDQIPEFSCPFCWEHFDVLGLCCHVDEAHPVDAKSGICPVCAVRIGSGTHLVGHITSQHGTLSLSRKGFLKGHAERSSSVIASSNPSQDQLLSALIYHLPTTDNLETLQPISSTAESPVESSDKNIIENLDAVYSVIACDDASNKRVE
ncbi:Drought induced 19 protein type, zinc-binding domain [Dillenia turbinata]|uniref:Drought induced 19 protein type, zinc-binding domain n=1 Tax=Dillenia turbinata TaxID=194707 RepID=A0AAN8ZNP9_9MAGN